MTVTAAPRDPLAIERFGSAALLSHIQGLGQLLQACVAGGAGVHFVMPFSQAEAEAFWRDQVMPSVESGGRVLFVAQQEGRIAGSVQLMSDMPPNQPHRTEVTKLLVHPDFRRRGIARALMAALEAEARQLGRSLITLDTVTGEKAEPLYASLGYETVGVIPGYSLHAFEPRYESTTVMYKVL